MRELVLAALSVGLAGSCAAVVVWAAAALLQKLHAPAGLLCLLWGVAALRFVLPAGVIPVPVATPQSVVAASGRSVVQTAPALELLTPQAAVSAAQPAAAVPTLPANAGGPSLTIWQLLAVVWAAGVLVLLLRATVSYWRLSRRVALACKTVDGCYCCPGVTSPFTLGLLHPRIYLPSGLQGSARRAVLLHERTHISRRDTFTKPLVYLVACLHWWNPLAWLVFLQFERTMENACDEATTRSSDDAERIFYCQTILRFAQRRTAPGSLSFGQGSTKERIRHVLEYHRPHRVFLALCTAVALLVGTACMAQPVAQNSGEPAKTETSAGAVLPTLTPSLTAEPDLLATGNGQAPNGGAAAQGGTAAAAPEFISPVKQYKYISAGFGAEHSGTDLAGEIQTPVYAAAQGVVTEARYDEALGNYVLLDHGTDANGDRWESLYAALDSISAAEGQTVSQGEKLGELGNSGNSTGPHLHLELHRNKTPVDPMEYCPIPEAATSDVVETEASAASAQTAPALDFICPLNAYTVIDRLYEDGGHKGVDFAAAEGTPIYAISDGIVTTAQTHSSYGNYVVIDHGTDAVGRIWSSLCAHMATITVQEGQIVHKGDRVGTVGNTGNVKGHHLHIELYCDDELLDPLEYIPTEPEM